jgi:hypothetical protein
MTTDTNCFALIFRGSTKLKDLQRALRYVRMKNIGGFALINVTEKEREDGVEFVQCLTKGVGDDD